MFITQKVLDVTVCDMEIDCCAKNKDRKSLVFFSKKKNLCYLK